MNYSLQCYMMELPIKSTFEELFSHLITIWGQDPETVQAKDLIVRQVTVCPVCVWCLSLMLTLRATPHPGWSSLSPGWLCFYLETSDISQISQFHLQNARPPHLASLYTELLIFIKVCMKIAPSICCSQVQSVCTLAFRSSGVKNFYFLCKITGGISWTFVYKVASPPVNYI